MMQPTPTSYNAVAKILHWLIAASIIGMVALGWIMTDMDKSPDKFALFQWHKSIGITILLLSVFRLVWRLLYRAPPLPANMKKWERYAAQVVHMLFYILIIGMPFTGWVIVSASSLNIPTILYGIVPWPHLPFIAALDNKKDIGEFFEELHGLLAYGIVGLLVVHILAAWKHHLVNRDDVLLRMAPKFIHPLLNWIGQR